MAYDTISLNNDNKILNKEENIEINDEIDNNLNNDNDILNDFLFYYEYNKMSKKLSEFFNTLLLNPYFIYFYTLLMDYFNVVIDNLFFLKINLDKKYQELKKKYFFKNKILDVYLINNEKFIEINNYTNNFDKNSVDELFNKNNMEIDNNSTICIRYNIDENKYRLYMKYTDVENKHYSDLPNNILDLIEIYDNSTNNNYIFKNECNEIEYAYLNDLDIKEIIDECNGPFNDFGLLYNNKVYVKNIMKENNINNLKKLEIKYKNYHLDEDKCELIDHIIVIDDDKKFICSDIIDSYLKKLN